MSRLPEDVLFLIFKELKLILEEEIPRNAQAARRPRLAPYTGVSRQWNSIIERETFKHIYVHSKELSVLRSAKSSKRKRQFADLHSTTPARFKQMMNRDAGRRREILRGITFVAAHLFSIHSHAGRSDTGRAANDEHFSRSVREFWKLLEQWEAPSVRGIALTLQHEHITESEWVHGETPWLNLVGGPLPRLRCITSFNASEQANVWPSSLTHIIASLTHVASLQLVFDDNIKDTELRRRFREGILSPLPSL